MGRNSAGVKGVTCKGDDAVVGMVVVKRDSAILAVTEHGYGKRTKISDFRNKHRGGQGVALIPAEGRNGPVVAGLEVIETDEVMMITRNGMIIRCPVRGISVIGRQAQGVKVINLNKGDSLVDVALLGEKDDDGPEGEGPEQGEDLMEADVQEVAEEVAEEAAEELEEAPESEPEANPKAKGRNKPAAGKRGKNGK
jgi:DNA gyrase subunit A